MKKLVFALVMLFVLSGCGMKAPAATPTTAPLPSATKAPPTSTATATLTVTPAPTATRIITATPLPYPAEGRGPTGFDTNVNPLTGLEVDDPAILERRPVVVKVENLPRDHRPQYGLNSADIVYEYYTEQGSTRFAAVFYGQDAETVGPIRSGRFFDTNVVQMYKAIFAFGSAYSEVWNRFINSDFANRLVIENDKSCPALCRMKGNADILVANTGEMNAYLKLAAIDNSRQNLDGQFFQAQAPAGGADAEAVFVRFSGAIYNRWDWTPADDAYTRYAEMANDVNNDNPQYALLTDRNDDSPITAANLVTICVPHRYFYQSAEVDVVEILPSPEGGALTSCDGKSYPAGSGPAFVARDGQLYSVTWTRQQSGDLLTLQDSEGKPFPLKPGRTWFEVIGASSSVKQEGGEWHFQFRIAP